RAWLAASSSAGGKTFWSSGLSFGDEELAPPVEGGRTIEVAFEEGTELVPPGRERARCTRTTRASSETSSVPCAFASMRRQTLSVFLFAPLIRSSVRAA